MSLLVVGSVAYDSIETPKAKIENALGGSATYFSTAASFFVPVRLVAVIGEDFEEKDINFLKNRNIDLQGLKVEPGKTFRWKGRYLENMNDRETIYTHLNVFETFNPVLPASYRESEFVFLANIGPDLQDHVIQQTKSKFVAMDTMNFWISGALPALKKTISRVDAMIINDSEVKMLAESDNLFTGARKIQAMGPQTLIIKKGEHGSILVHKDRYFFCPAYPVEQLYDPTGAGDTFAGGFMGYLAHVGEVNDKTLRQAVIFATAFASFCVEAFSVERLKEIRAADIQNRVQALIGSIKIDPHLLWDVK